MREKSHPASNNGDAEPKAFSTVQPNKPGHQYKILVNSIEDAYALTAKTGAFKATDNTFERESAEKLKRALASLLTDRTGLEDIVPDMMSARKVYPWPDKDWASILRDRFPHFEEVITLLERRQALCRLSNIGMSFPPILLAGPPGVGKTQFANELAKLMGVPYQECSMGGASAGWILGGNDISWSGSKPGRVFDTLCEGDAFNPIIVLDELDKIQAQNSNAPRADSALFTLLEKESAKRFKDEWIPLAIDASGIGWIATANDLRPVDEAISSRFRVFEIPIPTVEQRRQVAESVYISIRSKEDWGDAFESSLSAEVLDALADLEEGARAVKAKLIDALAIAAMEGRNFVVLKDLPMEKKPLKRSIGFM